MQSTCIDAATTQAKGDLIGKMIGESIEGASGVSDGESTGKVVVREFSGKLQGVSTKSVDQWLLRSLKFPVVNTWNVNVLSS